MIYNAVEYKITIESNQMDQLVYILKRVANNQSTSQLQADEAKALMNLMKSQGVPISEV